MPPTILFDLDDTLLSTHMDRFLPAYFKRLGKALNHLGSQQRITDQIHIAVQEMVANQDPGKTLKEVFDQNFYPALGTTEEACEQVLEGFYRIEYPKLKPITQPRPAALELVDWCKSEGIQMAIATNPLFPKTATYQRIQWGNLDPELFALFTSFNDFHFTKPHLTYYAEVLGRLGWPEGHIFMVGDNFAYDLLPMDRLGYETFWIREHASELRWEGGLLSDVKPWINQVLQTSERPPAYLPEAQIAILRSTPAVWDYYIRQVFLKHSNHAHQAPWKQILETLNLSAQREKELYLPLWEKLARNPKAKIHSPKQGFSTSSLVVGDQNPSETLSILVESRQSWLTLFEDIYANSVPDSADIAGMRLVQRTAEIVRQDQITLRELGHLLDIYKIN